MIPIQRIPLPVEIGLKLLRLSQEIQREGSKSDKKKKADLIWKRETFRRDVYRAIFETLCKMAPGVDCCMYCGNHLADHVDHFIPVDYAPTLSLCWFNHFLACSSCNSRFKREQHGLDAFNQPLLVDPTRDDPFRHIHLVLDTGEYADLTVKGEYTIRVCGLNRGNRPAARAHARSVIVELLRNWYYALEYRESERAVQLQSALRDQPFADVLQSMLRQAVHEAADIFFASIPDIPCILRNTELRRGLLVESGSVS